MTENLYLCADASGEPDSQWALVIGSYWGVCVDAVEPRPYIGHLFTTLERAEAWRAKAAPGTEAAQPYPWVWVRWDHGRYFGSRYFRKGDAVESTHGRDCGGCGLAECACCTMVAIMNGDSSALFD